MKASILLILVGLCSLGSAHQLHKRGVPHRTPPGTSEAGSAALQQINDQERVAEWSASSAVGAAVGRDYRDRLATTAQYVAGFTVPVTKEQAGRVFDVNGLNLFVGEICYFVGGKCEFIFIFVRRR